MFCYFLFLFCFFIYVFIPQPNSTTLQDPFNSTVPINNNLSETVNNMNILNVRPFFFYFSLVSTKDVQVLILLAIAACWGGEQRAGCALGCQCWG